MSATPTRRKKGVRDAMSAQRRIGWSKFNRRTFLALVRRGRKKKK